MSIIFLVRVGRVIFKSWDEVKEAARSECTRYQREAFRSAPIREIEVWVTTSTSYTVVDAKAGEEGFDPIGFLGHKNVDLTETVVSSPKGTFKGMTERRGRD
ncbi:hypothetical protein B0H13DRAFT_1912449 [Mycena leptocephala]|nr:hypothetical protein B0H13DRAFT_1912449 [Mycena leptocephala]